jgi:hypothetical protein
MHYRGLSNLVGESRAKDRLIVVGGQWAHVRINSQRRSSRASI